MSAAVLAAFALGVVFGVYVGVQTTLWVAEWRALADHPARRA